MKQKNLVSLSVALVFIGLSITGLLIYFGQKSRGIEHTHAWFGVLFVAAAVFHIVNNWSSLKGYTVARRNGAVQREFVVPALVVGAFAAGIGFNVPAFDALANAGKKLFAGERPKGPERLTFEEIRTNQIASGTPLTLILQKTKSQVPPVLVAWVEDSARRFVENLFVPAQVVGEKGPEPTPFSPTLLPDWQAKARNQQPNYERSTPTESFLLHTKTQATGSYFVVVALRAGETTERYEAKIGPAAGDFVRLNAAGGTLLTRALVERTEPPQNP